MEKTDPALGRDIPLNVFAGRIEGTGRVTLSTLHSVKGREFDAVITFGVNNGDFPNWHDNKNAVATREARRLFYVGVTRPRKELCLVYEEGNHSPWVAELHKRSMQN
ncbi:3'-5' exonuclease [Janthinobacterium sp. LS2A]|uniref:3'-5' exonuclease n=1 Tax=Janthinobacterium sp. LS2A TaxID=3118590 RepID=UPI002F927FD2